MKPIRHVPGLPSIDQQGKYQQSKEIIDNERDKERGAQATASRLPNTAPRGVGQPLFVGEPQILLVAKDLATGWGRRKNRTVLSSGISLRLAAGELVGLVGPNGSGKSTLLRTLIGLQPRQGGSILLCDKKIETLSPEERARDVACVFNERLDAGYFTVFDMVAFGRYPYTDARNRLSEDDRAQVERALAAVGMTSFAHHAFAALSDGEKQKTQLARAIAQDAPILVLDEPTAFLDAPSRMEIFELARSLAHEQGKAVIVCTHEVDLALRTADELWVMDKNHHFVSGTPAYVSFSGAIGTAFASTRARFDPASGTFRMDRSGRHF